MTSPEYQSAYLELEEHMEATGIPAHMWKDIENNFWCDQLLMLTFEPHSNGAWCCSPVLIRCQKDINASGWWYIKKNMPLFIYLKGQWRQNI